MSHKESSPERGFPTAMDLSDEDVFDAMKALSGYIDITIGDFKEIYRLAYQRAIERLTKSVHAQDIMSRPVIFATRGEGLAVIAQKMAESGISGLPVVETDGRVIGIISEKDFLRRMTTRGSATFMGVIADCLENTGCLVGPMLSLKAEDLMTSPAMVVSPETPITEITNLFIEKSINRVPVVDDRGLLLGIVSRADIIRFSFLRQVCSITSSK